MMLTIVVSTGFRLDTDAWLKEYEKCKDLTQEIVQLIQVGCLLQTRGKASA